MCLTHFKIKAHSAGAIFIILSALVFSTVPSNPAVAREMFLSESPTTSATPVADSLPDPTTSNPIALNPPRKIWTGWMPYYSMRTSLPAALNNQDLIKEIMLFWFTLKGPNRILDLYQGGNPSIPMDTPLAQMRAAGYQLIPTITDGTGKLELQKILSKPKQRSATIETLMNLIRSKNFDGIDLNFEGFSFVDGVASWEKTRGHWVEFIVELSAALKAENKILSVTTPVSFDPDSGKRGYWLYDWPAIAPHIDRLRIMTYDYATSRPGPIGPLFWAEDSLKYAVKVMPASKVFLGVAGYGRDWVTKVTGVCPKDVAGVVKAGARASTFVMRDAPNLVVRYGANAEYKVREGEVNFTYQRTYTGVTGKGSPTTCTASRTAWYQDPRGYMARANLVSKYRLGGLVAWTLGMEEPAAMNAVRAVSQDIAPDIVRADLQIDKSDVKYGEIVSLQANFTLTDKAPVAGALTTIQMKSEKSGWQDIFQGVTDQSGFISIRTLIGESVRFRALSEGSWERLASTSAEVAIASRPDITLASKLLSSKGRQETMTVQLAPLRAGVRVILEKNDPVKGKFVKAGEALTDENGSAQFQINHKERGFAAFRARSLADKKANFPASVSQSLWVTILER